MQTAVRKGQTRFLFEMATGTGKTLTAVEQEVLDGVTVRLIDSSERKRFDALIINEHYLHSVELVGEQLRCVAEYHGQW
ncbi:MAG: DEAD/DEAH box helicase family protein [Verrucomicrobia bacterium]|nr:DEAD/DEAH box helicase family protein [Verrucomicrobiota bacterium]